MIDCNKRLTEVSEVLSHLNRQDFEKIPTNIIDEIEENKDLEYVWHYDNTKELQEQNLHKDTIAILSYLNLKYLLNDEQRKFVYKIFQDNQKKMENEKLEKYNPNNIFQNDKSKAEENNQKDLAMITYKETVFMKIKKWLKNTFKIKK